MRRSLCIVPVSCFLICCGSHRGLKVIQDAAAALGGKDKILNVRTLEIAGDGLYMSLGQNATPEGPLPVWKVSEFRQAFDLARGRMRLREVRTAQFPSGTESAVRQNIGIDGEIAWDVDERGNARRITERAAVERRVSALHYPLAILRAAFHSAARLSAFRQVGNFDIVDISTANGDSLTLAIDRKTRLPVSVISTTDQPNLGDVDIETDFQDYADVGGLKVPGRITTRIDKWPVSDIRVSRTTLNGEMQDMAAPDAIRVALPAPANPPIDISAMPVREGIWWLGGKGSARSVVFEFSDHLTVFEVPESEARARAVIAKARSLAFGKPLTEAIVSSHRFADSAGLRVAVAEGLTIIAQRGNVAFFRELLTRPHTLVPDELATGIPPQIKITPVDDSLILKDDAMELDLYRVKNDPQAGTLLMGWAPRDRILVQAGLYDSGWLRFPFVDILRENLQLRNLKVETDVPIHGEIESYAEVLKKMQQNRVEESK